MNTVLTVSFCVALACKFVMAMPMLPETEENYDVVRVNDSNGIPHTLYVVKTVVYEVGILADADNETESEESYEEINLKFYDPNHNGSVFDLSSGSVPIETNLTGEAVSGIRTEGIGFLPFWLLNDTNLSKNESTPTNDSVQSVTSVSPLEPEEQEENLPLPEHVIS